MRRILINLLASGFVAALVVMLILCCGSLLVDAKELGVKSALLGGVGQIMNFEEGLFLQWVIVTIIIFLVSCKFSR